MRGIAEGLTEQDIADIDADMCQMVFNAVEPKTYKRTDFEPDKTRVGFIAQDLKAVLPAEFQNIVGTYGMPLEEDGPDVEMYGVDYARLTTILWSVVKNLQARVDRLEAGSAA